MGETGILAPDARVELIDGEIVDMAAPGDLHAGTVDQLASMLTMALAGRAHIRVQNPLLLDERSEPQPDISVLEPRGDFYKTGRPRPENALLVVEVADTSLRFDREEKIPLYARHGIREVWLVDLEAERLIRYRSPQQGTCTYALADRPDLSKPIEIDALPGAALELAAPFSLIDFGEAAAPQSFTL